MVGVVKTLAKAAGWNCLAAISAGVVALAQAAVAIVQLLKR